MATVIGSQRKKVIVLDTATIGNLTITGAISGYATTSYVTTQISNLVDSSPATLDTLNELAAALGDDPNFATTTANSIGTKWTQNNTKISQWDTAYTYSQVGHLPLAGGTVTGNLAMANTADLKFIDQAGTYPTSGKGFDWTLNNDGARIYAIQPSSDSIDLTFELRDNATSNDRFVFFVNDYQGTGYDKYPLVIRGGTQFDLVDSALYTNGTLRLSNSGVLNNVTNTNWDTAYGWGNHASAGYTSNVGDITGVTAGTGLTGGGTSGTPTLNVIGGSGITANANDIAVDSTVIRTTGNQTKTGDLTISKADAKIKLYDSTGTSGNNPFVEWETNAGQGIQMGLNIYDGELPVSGYGLVVEGGPSNTQFPTTGTLTFNVLGEMYAGGTTLSSLNKVFHDGYHPNADKWTSARTLTLSGDVTGSVSFDGSGAINMTNTVVGNNSHTHNNLTNYVLKAGDTMTGKLVLGDVGYSLGDEYHKWKRAYTVSTSSPQEILYSDGNSLPNGGVYRFTAHISGTGTDQFATAVYWNQNGTWRINVTGQSGTSSNHPEFIIDATTNKPTIHIDHSTVYGISILGERIELSEATGTDNAGYAFGTDAFLGSVNNNLYFLPGGTTATGQNSYDDGNIVWHTGNLTTTNKSNYDTAFGWGNHASAGYTSNVGDITGVTAGTGLTGGATSGTATLNVIGGSGITANADNITVDSTVVRTTGNQTLAGGLTISGSVDSGATDMGFYQSPGTNIVLKGDSVGRSGIFFESEKDGVNINDPSDYGFIQFHAYGYGATTGESADFVIGVSNDSTDNVILQSPYNGGVKVGYTDGTSGTGLTTQTIFHDAYHPNADKWTSARTLTLSGDVTGSVSFDGSAAINMTNTVVANNSHTHNNLTNYVLKAGDTITGNLNVNGVTTLGNGPSDQTHINDTLYLGATDSGDSHFYFGENSSSWYGDHWYWDSAYGVERYSRYAGTDSLIEKHDTRYTHKVQTNRAYERLSHSTGYQIGSYNTQGDNAAKTNPIYTIGDNYRPADTTLGNMYGIGYAHNSSAAFLSGDLDAGDDGWGLYVAADGDARIFLGASNGTIKSTGRHYANGSVVWNAGNDGSGSGLDSDLLDGQQGSYYLDYNNFANTPTIPQGDITEVIAGTGMTGGGTSGVVTLNVIGGSGITANADEIIVDNTVLRTTATQEVSSGVTRFNSSATMATASGGQSRLEVYRNGTGSDAFMTFHVGGDYATYFGLDGGTNKLSVGGWSMGANSYAIYHEGNKPSLAALGYTGATDANKYVLPTGFAGDDFSIDTGALTGAAVISDLDINITTDTSGRVTDANGTIATRNLTAADIGAPALASSYRTTSTASGTAATGWVTVATCTDARKHAEVIVSDSESSDHAFIRIDWLRSYNDTNFSVLNVGGHGNRITGVRVLNQTGSTTYGTKKLQIYVTTSSNYQVRVNTVGSPGGYGVITAVTPVLQNTISGYALQGNQLTNLDRASLAAEQGIIAGGNIYANNSQRVFADDYHPNADKWSSARALTLSGDITGSVSFDGSGAINMTNTVVANDSINSQHYAAGSIDNEHIADNAINSEHYAAGSIDNEHIADNAINSEHYADGSIDRAHLAADIIDGTKIANDVINSEHYVAGSIDNEHIADNAINSEHYADNSIDALHLNVSGNGTTSQYLRSDGDGTMSWVTPTNTTYTTLPNGTNLNASYGVIAAAGNGLKFWNGSDAYKIAMGNSAEYHYGPVTDYSIKSIIDSNSSTRGFTWGVNGGTPIAALNVGTGALRVAGTFTAGGEVYTSASQDAWGFRATTGATANSSGLWFTSTRARILLRDGTGNIITQLSASGTNSENVINGNTIWHAGNDGASSGLDAGLLAGALPAEDADVSTIVKRTSAGEIKCARFNVPDGSNHMSHFVSSSYNQIASTSGASGSARDLRFNLGQVGTIMTITSANVRMHKPVLLGGSANTSFAASNINSTQSSDVNGSARFHMNFTKANGTTSLGRITSNNYGTTYTTSSDYRLKEDLLEVTDATARLLSIQTRNFKWIGTDFRTDGFLAHELALVVPDAVVGEKDAMSTPTLYSEEEELPEGVSVGDVKVASVPDYQSIDQSKLVPLLIKTVQELEARIRALENS